VFGIGWGVLVSVFVGGGGGGGVSERTSGGRFDGRRDQTPKLPDRAVSDGLGERRFVGFSGFFFLCLSILFVFVPRKFQAAEGVLDTNN
jgi:hypothetical protein